MVDMLKNQTKPTDRHLAIINLFQLVIPYEKPTSSDIHHTTEREKLLGMKFINSYIDCLTLSTPGDL